MFISLFIAAVGFIFIFSRIRKICRIYTLIQKIPGPKQTPVVGNLLDTSWNEGAYFRNVKKWRLEHGPVFRMFFFYLPLVVVTSPEDCEHIVGGMKHLNKGPFYDFLNRWLGKGLLISRGRRWYTRRKLLTPAFHFGILQDFVQVFGEEAQNLVEVLKKMDGHCVNVIPIMSQTTLKIIMETAMGMKLNLQNQEDLNFLNATVGISKCIFFRLLRPWLCFSHIYYYFNSMGRHETKLVDIFHRFCKQVINERRKHFNERGYNDSGKKKQAMLDILLKAYFKDRSIDEQGIEDEVNTFMFEGHDTTSMSMCFTIMLLANHQEVQQSVYQEIIDVLSDTNKYPTIKELNELKLMERCLKESLRLYPSVPHISRIIEKDYITAEGHVIPAGVVVNVHIYDIHRNPDQWKDPEKFDPDRFLPENCAHRHPFAYVPFSAGPRNCIGQKFAILEEKVLLCAILKEFKLEAIHTPQTIEVDEDLLLRPKDEVLNVKLIPRR